MDAIKRLERAFSRWKSITDADDGVEEALAAIRAAAASHEEIAKAAAELIAVLPHQTPFDAKGHSRTPQMQIYSLRVALASMGK